MGRRKRGRGPSVKKYVHYPVPVSVEFRRAVLSAYPALEYHTNAAAYRRLAEYFIFGCFDDNKHDGLLVVPHDHIKELVDFCPTSKAFCALEWLEAFSREVWPLTIHPYSKKDGLARTIERELPEKILNLLDAEPIEIGTESVWFYSGVPVTRSKLYAESRTYIEQLKMLADGIGEEHPAHALMVYLNEQPPHKFNQVIQDNWGALLAAFNAMPTETPQDVNRHRSARLNLIAIRNFCRMIYKGTDHSPRLYACGPTVHCLPRELRKVALAGCTSLDVRSCQLAIVAKLWNVPLLLKFLEDGKSIWTELYQCLGTDERDKPTLKIGIYSIIFGMGLTRLKTMLKAGDGKVPGLGDPKLVEKFLEHPLIRELLQARQARLREIRRNKFVVDAFDRRIEYDRHNCRLRSLLAQEVQSYEVKLMLSLLPVFEAERDLNIVSFLHDGLTIHISDSTKKGRIIERLKNAFQIGATSLGFITELEQD